ncbi:MAG: acyl-CoA dehydrogenase family protein [Woeseiaceae bacterium]|nr:acyl-CoA dehydrogenase family protein [Woeseiaceae bacterium]
MPSAIDAEILDMTLDAVQRFAADALPENLLLDLDADEEFPVKLVKDLCGETIGVQLLFIPEEYGGMGGGAFDVYRVCEAMARVDLGIATGVLATFLGSDPIRVGGTPEQQAHWMGRLAEEGLLMAYAATEPLAGSDLGALKTRAEPVGDNGDLKGYKITGSKQWISNGGFADLYSVLALAPGGPTWFLIEAGTEGLSHGKPEDKHGIRDSNTAAVMLDNVYVPKEQLLGGVEGQGLAQAQRVFGYTRLMVAAFGLGCGVEAMSRAIEYSKERVQAGTPLSEKQGYTHKLIVPNVVRLEGGRAFIEETAARIDAGEGSLITEGAIAKYFSSEAGNAAAEAGIQALGGYGYTREYMVEKIKRDVRITMIYEGTSEIMEMTIARDRWQWHLKSRGDYYHGKAREMEQLHAAHPETGAATVALALHALAEILERCRVGKLTRNQHVLFRLGELIAWAECAASLAKRAAAATDGRLDEKADTRYPPETLNTMARILARQAAAKVASDGLALVVGADTSEPAGLADALNLRGLHSAQLGMIKDMNKVADALYER